MCVCVPVGQGGRVKRRRARKGKRGWGGGREREGDMVRERGEWITGEREGERYREKGEELWERQGERGRID